MEFWLKKLISSFLLPLPFGLCWIAIGIILSLFCVAPRLRNICLLIGFCIITVFSISPVSSSLLDGLQHRYPPLMSIPAGVTQVAVLGGGLSGNKNYPPNLTLGSASLSRLVEGIRLLKMIEKNNPNAQLILSGGRVFQSPAVAGKMRNTALMLGVNPQNALLEDGSLDTREEAVYLKKFVGTNPFVLVTSAYHMPRAMDLFKSNNMHPIAAPTQFLSQHDSVIRWPIPNTNCLVESDIAIHEYLGIWWGKLRGYIKK